MEISLIVNTLCKLVENLFKINIYNQYDSNHQICIGKLHTKKYVKEPFFLISQSII